MVCGHNQLQDEDLHIDERAECHRVPVTLAKFEDTERTTTKIISDASICSNERDRSFRTILGIAAC